MEYKTDTIAFINIAYDDIRRRALDPLFADVVRGHALIPHLRPRDSILKVRTVTLRIADGFIDYGVPAIFADPLHALSFHNAVHRALKKMDPPIP